MKSTLDVSAPPLDPPMQKELKKIKILFNMYMMILLGVKIENPNPKYLVMAYRYCDFE